MTKYLLALDQGTTSSRAILFDKTAKVIAKQAYLTKQFFPKDGYVEQDAQDIWQTSLQAMQDVLKTANASANDIIALGITNQRETIVAWDKATDKVLHPAIVWQDRRTADYCQELKAQNLGKTIQAKTGLLLDPYFSATKIRWLLDNSPQVQKSYRNKTLAFGTIDSFLLWRLSGGTCHKTDATNASRTMLYNINNNCYDKEILQLLDITEDLLPEVLSCNSIFAHTKKDIFGEAIPIAGMVGDQHAATIGQGCFNKGMVKSTYGTGCFALLNIGEKPIISQNNLLTTIAYKFDNDITYAIEGSIFNAGTAISFLKENFNFIASSKDSAKLALNSNNENVIFIPAFTGLGAPYWQPNATGTILGIRRDTSKADIVKAALESISFQTKDLLSALEHDYNDKITRLRVDGGMVNNSYLTQNLSDILQLEVEWPENIEVTALGAALVAGLKMGVYTSLDEINKLWQAKSSTKPKRSLDYAMNRYKKWQKAIEALIAYHKDS